MISKSNDNSKILYPEFLELSKDIYLAFVGDLFNRIDAHWSYWSMTWIRHQLGDPYPYYDIEHRAAAIAKRLLITAKRCSINSKERAPYVAKFLPEIEKHLTAENLSLINMPEFIDSIID